MRRAGTVNVMLAPETAQEAGLMQWLAERFKGKRIKLEFGTTSHQGCDYHPMLWITPIGEPLPFESEEDSKDGL